jgi:hypothetical protein
MNRRAITLIEVIMGVLIGSLLLAGVSRMFLSGLKISQKGSSHLTNVQAAAILLNQIEEDLEMATELPSLETPVDSIQFKVAGVAENQPQIGTSTIDYSSPPEGLGYSRTILEYGDTTPRTHVFCQGLLVRVRFESLVLPGPPPQKSFMVDVSVKSPKGTEENAFRRFVYCFNLPENSQWRNFGWNW